MFSFLITHGFDAVCPSLKAFEISVTIPPHSTGKMVGKNRVTLPFSSLMDPTCSELSSEVL